jgi:hypothetical protein
MKVSVIVLSTLAGLGMASPAKNDNIQPRDCPFGVDGALTAGVLAVNNFPWGPFRPDKLQVALQEGQRCFRAAIGC